MLSPEAKAAMMARLSEATQEAEAPDAVVVETPEVVVEAAPVSPDVTQEATPTETTPTQPKMVPLDDLVKVRQDRRAIREELAKERESRARLEGELNALKQASKQDDWVADALKPDANEDQDPNADLRTRLEVIESERRQTLLSNVIHLVKEAEPTLPEDRLIKGLARGESPQEIVTEWQALRQEILKSVPPTVVAQPAPNAPTRQSPPPTVARATAVAGAPKPTSWADVSKAIKQASK